MKLQERILAILEQSNNILNKHFPNLPKNYEYLAVYAHDEKELSEYTNELNQLAQKISQDETGSTYKIANKINGIDKIKIYVPMADLKELGAPDVRLENYEVQKEELIKNPNISIVNSGSNEEMLVLKDSEFNAAIYFPSTKNEVQIENSNDELYKVKAELESEKTKRVQLLADFVNFQKRVENERSTYGAIANMALIEEILEVFSDLDMAMNDAELNLESSKSAISSAQNKLSVSITRAGVEKLDVKVGDEFDKSKMEAISTIPVQEENQKNKVIAVISAGFKYIGKDIILKAAKVIVGK